MLRLNTPPPFHFLVSSPVTAEKKTTIRRTFSTAWTVTSQQKREGRTRWITRPGFSVRHWLGRVLKTESTIANCVWERGQPHTLHTMPWSLQLIQKSLERLCTPALTLVGVLGSVLLWRLAPGILIFAPCLCACVVHISVICVLAEAECLFFPPTVQSHESIPTSFIPPLHTQYPCMLKLGIGFSARGCCFKRVCQKAQDCWCLKADRKIKQFFKKIPWIVCPRPPNVSLGRKVAGQRKEGIDWKRSKCSNQGFNCIEAQSSTLRKANALEVLWSLTVLIMIISKWAVLKISSAELEVGHFFIATGPAVFLLCKTILCN